MTAQSEEIKVVLASTTHDISVGAEHDEQEPWKALCDILDYDFTNPSLLNQALTRRSAIEEQVSQAAPVDYQRLEFIGDRVINFVIMTLIAKKRPDFSEAQLHEATTICVANDGILPEIGVMVELERYVIRGVGEQVLTEKMYADAVEAMMGAIYLDNAGDLSAVQNIVARLWQPFFDDVFQFVETEQNEVDDITAGIDQLALSDESFDFEDYFAADIHYGRRAGGQSSHFDSGIYEFTKKVINWDFDDIARPLRLMRRTSPIPVKLEAVDSASRHEYYQRFRDLALEETRAVIQAGLEAYDRTKAPQFKLKLMRFKQANNEGNPSLFIMSGKLPRNLDCGSSMIAVLIEPVSSDSDLRLLGLASYKDDNPDKRFITFKIKSVVSYVTTFTHESVFEGDAQWKISVLGGLVTQARIYDVCTKMPQQRMSELERQRISGQISTLPDVIEPDEDAASQLIHLNASQQVAVISFLALDQGIQLIQGPPGTGKTTTIISLLTLLYQQGERILVSAPSNKAVQILANRFFEKHPDAPIVLAGIKRKLDPKLRPVFLHTWGDDMCERLGEVIEIITKLQAALAPELELNLEIFVKQLVFLVKEIDCISAEIKKTAPSYHQQYYFNRMMTTLTNLSTILETITEDIDQTQLRRDISRSLNTIRTSIDQQLRSLSMANTTSNKQPVSQLEKSILNHVRLIFATLSVSGRKALQEMSKVDTLVIDEAGQSVEAENLIPFALNPDKALLVGDTKQLPAVVLSQAAVKRHYRDSMMWRLSDKCQQPSSLLDVQYRMDPEIRLWPSDRFYASRLQDADAVIDRAALTQHLHSALIPCAFIDIQGKEALQHYSYYNPKEASQVTQIVRYLKFNKIKLKDIGVITFYAAQVEKLKQMLAKVGCIDVKVSTVDGFQGGERDFIIISFVRANPRGRVGFLTDFRRLNVAITRAKLGLIMLGHVKTLERKASDVAALINNMRERGRLWQQGLLDVILPLSKHQAKRKRSKPATQSKPWTTYRIRPKKSIRRYKLLFKQLNYRFKNIGLLTQALTRQSALEEKINGAADRCSHQLMLIGDRLLKLVLASVVLKTLTAVVAEGELHTAEEALRSEAEMLPKIASSLKLGQYLIKGLSEQTVTPKMQADALKALLGAIYLDTQRLEPVEQVVTRLWAQTLPADMSQQYFSDAGMLPPVKKQGRRATQKSHTKPISGTKPKRLKRAKPLSATARLLKFADRIDRLLQGGVSIKNDALKGDWSGSGTISDGRLHLVSNWDANSDKNNRRIIRKLGLCCAPHKDPNIAGVITGFKTFNINKLNALERAQSQATQTAPDAPTQRGEVEPGLARAVALSMQGEVLSTDDALRSEPEYNHAASVDYAGS